MAKGKTKEKDDLTLYWNNFLSGNDVAFAKIYEKMARNLFSFGTTFTSDSDLIKNCIQDVFVRLYQNRAQLTHVDNIKIYLLIALKNALLDSFKKQQVYEKFMDSYEIEEQFETSEEERIIAQEKEMADKKMIDRCLSLLTKRQREIIHYRFVEELSIEKIANLLDINYQSVANSIQKSLKKIRKKYLNGGYKN